MTPETFEFKLLVATISHVNVRTEKRGEDPDVLAVDVKFKFDLGEGDGWDDVLRKLLDDVDEPEEFAKTVLAPIVSFAPFSAEYLDYKVVVKSPWAESMPILTTLHHAKLNKFRLDFQDEKNKHSAFALTMRAQCSEIDGELVGEISELIGKQVGIELVAGQIPLALPAQEDPVQSMRTAADILQ